MESNTPSPVKSAKRVVIRIDPVPDLLDQTSSQDEIYNYDDSARYVMPDEEITGPPKSALKSTRRPSLFVAATPQSPVKHVTMRRISEPLVLPELDDYCMEPHHKDIENVMEEEEVIPEHHQVLYDLLGADKAESILNPKMEEPTKTTEEATSDHRQSRKLPAVDTGLGADALWKILKKESDKKLHKMERKIPQEWKVSYGAFLRDSINQSRPLVHRSFTHQTDVPELDKLLDKRYKERVRKARHHTNVMFRASENNKNKTTLLLNNNPVPDYNDREGEEALTRYFDETSPLQTYDTLHAANKQLVPYDQSSNEEGERVRQQFSNLHFLSENAARTKGTFYGKYSNDEMIKMVTDFPGYKVDLPPSMTARVTVSAPVHDPTGIRPTIERKRIFTRKESAIKRDPTWQPLTVGALMEYASTKHALGLGEFRHGQISRWKTPAPSTA